MDRERIFEGWLDDEPTDDEDEEQRKKKASKDAEVEPETDDSDTEESEPVEYESEPERPRRVPIAEVTATLPEDVRFRVEQALARHGGEWFLEKGRYLYTRLTRTEVITDNGHEIEVTERLALRRDELPRLPEPARLQEIVKQVVKEPDRAEEFVSELADVDEIELRVQTAEGERIIRIAPEPEPQAEPTSESSAPEPEPAKKEATTPDSAPETTKEPQPDTESAPEVEQEDKVPEEPQVEPEEVVALIREVREEPEEEPAAPAESAQPEQGAEQTIPEPAEEVAEIPLEGTETPPDEDMPLAEVVETIKEAADARALDELPIMAGGSQELDEQPRRRKRRDDEEYEPAPAPRRKRKPAPSKDYERQLMEWERHYRSPEKKPDAKLKRQARKLIRAMARRYGIRLTPETEAQLLGIMLAPRLIDGRKVYGLFVNIEEVMRVLETLWLHYPAAAPRVY